MRPPAGVSSATDGPATRADTDAVLEQEATNLAMAFSVFHIGLYVLITGPGLFGLMMVPGLIMMRLNARAG